ncbi:sulfurtransferase complex subunit TusC [Shewanella waksmanii]|uniref:sulfurtransferase complex subunit TusC n=1 Tax=Shewanella waksmanii TaxID=213783 RepID=UPI00048C7B93|nr:sulfurtransferase complex subunit TusC [Shewanella waksmanii]
MKKLLIIFRHSPQGSSASREGLDVALLSATFEQQVTILFCDEGVYNLPKQQAALTGNRDFLSTFKALPMYDIDDVYACQSSLKRYGVDAAQSPFSVDVIDEAAIKQQINLADEVLVF